MELPSFRHPKLYLDKLWRAWPDLQARLNNMNMALLKVRYHVGELVLKQRAIHDN